MAETDDQTAETGEKGLQPDVTEGVPEPEPLPPAPALPPARRRGGFVAPLLGGVLAAAAGFGVAQVVPDGWPLAKTAALEQEITAQTAEIARLADRLATLEGQPAPDLSPLMDTLATLNGRVVAVENGPAMAAENTAALAEAVARLQADLATLKSTGIAPGAGSANAALAAEVEARMKAAEEAAARIEAEAAALKAEAETMAKAAAARDALAALQTAIEGGGPFAAELAALGIAAPDALAQHAETGLPSLATLQEAFPEAARKALESALRADMGDSWTERATSFLLSQTGARSLTPREGSDPDAILSRAEAALGAGDLDLTLTELAGLPEVSRTAMADWRATAEQRQAALAALAEIAGKFGG